MSVPRSRKSTIQYFFVVWNLGSAFVETYVWFKSYLWEREQYVSIRGKSWPAQSWLRRSMRHCFSTLMFTQYAAPLEYILLELGLVFMLFADDSLIYSRSRRLMATRQYSWRTDTKVLSQSRTSELETRPMSSILSSTWIPIHNAICCVHSTRGQRPIGYWSTYKCLSVARRPGFWPGWMYLQ